MMRRFMALTILSMAFLMVLATCAGAQVVWSGGFKGGLNLAKLTGDGTDISGTDTEGGTTVTIDGKVDDLRLGFVGGGFITAKVHENFGVQLEALYTQKGGKGDLYVTASNGSVTIQGNGEGSFSLGYFEIPLLAVGMFPAGEKATVNVFGGPTLAFNTGGTFTFEFEGESADEDIPSDALVSTIFGLAFGAGVVFEAGERVNVVVEARYSLGLQNAFENDPDGTESDVRTSEISIMAGVSFPFGAGGGGI